MGLFSKSAGAFVLVLCYREIGYSCSPAQTASLHSAGSISRNEGQAFHQL